MKTKVTYVLMMLITMITSIGFCSGDETKLSADREIGKLEEGKMGNLTLSSTAFDNGSIIPKKYTCDGQDISTPLNWGKVPDSTKSLALICDDPDAPMGTWVHWVVINLPPNLSGLAENVNIGRDSSLAGTIECQNDFDRTAYGGPCPPKGPAHRYYFKLYALDTRLDLTSKATKKDVENAMAGHILAKGELIGKYGR